jgi:hypothetical protein
MTVADIYFHRLVRELRLNGVAFDEGLTDDEISRVEREYDFRFPPDLRDFLHFSLPISDGFPNWRIGDVASGKQPTAIRERMDWPSAGICFDVERNNFWAQGWGTKPEDLESALKIARQKLGAVPKLIPLYSHRYISSEPLQSGNPIFSVYQSDVIYYGNDLPSYFAHEFGVNCPDWTIKQPRKIPFWSELAESRNN